MALRKNVNKGDVEITLSQKTNNSLKTDEYMTAIRIFVFTALIHSHYVEIAVIYWSVFRLLFVFFVTE